MITPLFDVSQSSDTVTVSIRAPFTRPRDFEISAVGPDFHFHCSPYFLHLRFPGGVLTDSDAASAKYDFDSGTATVVLAKEQPGVHFPHLGSLSALLVKRAEGLEPPRPQSARIEVIASSESSDGTVARDSNSCASASGTSTSAATAAAEEKRPSGSSDHAGMSFSSVSSPQTISLSSLSSICSQVKPDKESPREHERVKETASAQTDAVDRKTGTEEGELDLHGLTISAPCYGFGDRYEGVFTARAENVAEVVELPQPDSTPAWQRAKLRREAEIEAFDPEHYVADYMEAAFTFQDVLDFVPDDISRRKFSESEKTVLVNLPRREYLEENDAQAVADLAGILFASCYDLRITFGERSCESAWAISRLTPVLSFLEHASDVESALRSAFAASLLYPLYRHRGLASSVVGDVRQLLSGDCETVRARLLRTLLDVREIYEESPVYRLYSDIFLTDYCVWVQHVSDGVLDRLAEQVAAASVPMECLPWDLSRLQKYAEQIDSHQEPDDSAPVWLWGATPDPETYFGRNFDVGTGTFKEAAPSDTPVRPDSDRTSHGGEGPDVPEVLITANRPRNASRSSDSLDELGLRPVVTRTIARGDTSQRDGIVMESDSGSESSSDESDTSTATTSSCEETTPEI